MIYATLFKGCVFKKHGLYDTVQKTQTNERFGISIGCLALWFIGTHDFQKWQKSTLSRPVGGGQEANGGQEYHKQYTNI